MRWFNIGLYLLAIIAGSLGGVYFSWNGPQVATIAGQLAMSGFVTGVALYALMTLAVRIPWVWLKINIWYLRRRLARMDKLETLDRRLGGRRHLPKAVFPRLWVLMAYFLPKRIREQAYEPARHELLEDYLLARRSYRTKWAKRLLWCAFTFRTALMVADSIRVLISDTGFQLLLKLVPEPVRRWWSAGQ